jgi:hypothetical protein
MFITGPHATLKDSTINHIINTAKNTTLID